jgi:quercetin dioxygenase-like cupin family protein
MRVSIRDFLPEQHIRNLLTGNWVPMYDDKGQPLSGIRGRTGVSAETVQGVRIGLDLMEMSPGSAFPRHVHSGDHILFFLTAGAEVDVGAETFSMLSGDGIVIPAEQPHSVRVASSTLEPVKLLAFGHPHVELDSLKRMRVVDESR